MARSYGAVGASLCGVVVMMMIIGTAAQAPAPSPDCPTVVLTLTDCLTFVTGGEKTPPAACCSELSAVITNSPQCLCLLFNTTFTEPLGVNVTLAQQLPPACNLTTPPTSLCALVGVPVSGPVSAVAPSPAATTPTSASPASSPMAPNPMSSTPAPATTTPVSSPASTPPMTTAPAVPVDSPPATPTSSPNGASSTTSQNAAVAATFLFFASIFLS